MCKFDIMEQDFNPTIFFASKEKMKKSDVYHEHDFAEITYVLSGQGRYFIEGITYDVEAGDIIMCNPGVKHKNIIVNYNEPTVEFFTGFTDFEFYNMPPNSILFKDGSHILRINSQIKQEITKHCYEMLAENDGAQVGKYFMMKAHLMQILLIIVREIIAPDGKKMKGCNFESYSRKYAVKRIISYLSENYENKISLDQIAQNMYLSPVYISKIFKEETGDSPINYLINIRLEKAREILVNGERNSVKNIANLVGYEDVYHFSKLFKKHFGISPLYYKKTNEGNNA
jgi:AraC-like DNA-binding protein